MQTRVFSPAQLLTTYNMDLWIRNVSVQPSPHAADISKILKNEARVMP